MDQNQHFGEVSAKINAELDAMFMTYDTKILATALMMRAGGAFRAILAAKLWRREDVLAVVNGTTEHIFEPLPEDQIPRVSTIGISGRAS